MTARVLIIDEQGVYRRLFAHHVLTGFDSPTIAEYDPVARGKLPADFSGSAYDAVLLGDAPGEANGLGWLRDLCRRNGFPPVIFFLSSPDAESEEQALAVGFRLRGAEFRVAVPPERATLEQTIGGKLRRVQVDFALAEP